MFVQENILDNICGKCSIIFGLAHIAPSICDTFFSAYHISKQLIYFFIDKLEFNYFLKENLRAKRGKFHINFGLARIVH